MEVRDLGSAKTTEVEPGQQQTQPAAGDTAAQGDGSQSQKPARPEWLPEDYFDADKGAIKLDDFGKHYGEIATGAKAEVERLAAYPKKIEDLKFELPADLKLPEGVKFDDTNPQFQAFRNFVFEKKLDPAIGTEVLGMYVREKAGEVDAINKRVDQELAKLGDNGAARIESLRTFFTGKVGADLAKSVMAGIFTEPQVKAMEKIMLAMSNQNTQEPHGGNRDEVNTEISDEDYAKLSPTEKLNLARNGGKRAS